MSSASASSTPSSSAASEVSWPRVLWVAPLTVIVALAVNFGIKFLVQAINPSLARMPQLDTPMVSLTVIGSLAAIVAFIAVVLVTRRPFFWYRVLAVGALLLSWIPDIALGIGGQSAFMAMRLVGPLASIGMAGSVGPPPGGPGRSGGPGVGPPGGGGGFSASIEQVLVLMLLHLATALVCVVLLTTLTRKPVQALAPTHN
jgi:hypothetical protein